MHAFADGTRLLSGRLPDVWDVSKHPKTPLKRPGPAGLLRVDETESESASEPGGRVGRLKMSHVVPGRGCDVPGRSDDVADMSFGTGLTQGIGVSARAATLMGGKAATRPLAVRSAIARLQRVRAFMRVTQRATGSMCGRRAWTGGAVWLTPHGSRHEPVTLLFDAGGPGPLTEDRQKPRRRMDGMHETRNTVHSIAFAGANRAFRCGSWDASSRSG